MRQKLEQLIEELGGYKADLDNHGHPWNRGWNSALAMAEKRIREVLAYAPENGIEVPVKKDDD